jgi:predicted AAA+ superfamily ATPase
LRLHPITIAELDGFADSQWLMASGGFPEPFFGGSEVEARRWRHEYQKRLVDEDVRSLENLKSLGGIELLATRLPELVGSPLSVNALREDLQVSHKTVALWVDVLERLYHIFRIYPLGSALIRAIKKEPKHYHFDWSLIKEPGYRFENFVACHLLKWVHYQEDTLGQVNELRYFRDTDQREVDFVVVQDGKPIYLIECKLSGDRDISKHLRYLKNKFPDADAMQLCWLPCEEFVDKHGCRQVQAESFLKGLI